MCTYNIHTDLATCWYLSQSPDFRERTGLREVRLGSIPPSVLLRLFRVHQFDALDGCKCNTRWKTWGAATATILFLLHLLGSLWCVLRTHATIQGRNILINCWDKLFRQQFFTANVRISKIVQHLSENPELVQSASFIGRSTQRARAIYARKYLSTHNQASLCEPKQQFKWNHKAKTIAI